MGARIPNMFGIQMVDGVRFLVPTARKQNEKMCSVELNTIHLNTKLVHLNTKLFGVRISNGLVFQWTVGPMDFRSHLKLGPFATQPLLAIQNID